MPRQRHELVCRECHKTFYWHRSDYKEQKLCRSCNAALRENSQKRRQELGALGND